MELYVEGATRVQESSGWVIVGSVPPKPTKNGASWDRLREDPFTSEAEAWAWVESKHDQLARNGIFAVRLLSVVGYRVPQIITLLHEATQEQVAACIPKREKAAGLQYGDLPGDEWKRGDD